MYYDYDVTQKHQAYVEEQARAMAHARRQQQNLVRTIRDLIHTLRVPFSKRTQPNGHGGLIKSRAS